MNDTQVFEMSKHTNIYTVYTIYIYVTHTQKRLLSLCLGKHRVSPTTLALFDIKTKLNQKTMPLRVNLIYIASLTMLDCIPTLLLQR